MTRLRASDSLQLLNGVGSHFLRFLIFLLLSLVVLLLRPLTGQETLFDPLRTVAVDLRVAELLQ